MAKRTTRDPLRRVIERASKDPKFFHDLVFDPTKALSRFPDLSPRVKATILELDPELIIATLLRPADACGKSCNDSCDSTCGKGSCGDTCGSSCKKTCDDQSCAKTAKMEILGRDWLAQWVAERVSLNVAGRRTGR